VFQKRLDSYVSFEKEHYHPHSVGDLLIVANSGSKVGVFSTKRQEMSGGETE